MYKRLGLCGRGGALGGGGDGGLGGGDGGGGDAQPYMMRPDERHWYPLLAVRMYSHNWQPPVQSTG
eukprot:scaffold196200_cov29-Tisochrysis_lutea.AAC.2